jgi:hypothetical protein
MSYKGRLLRDLHSVVEVCLQRNNRTCINCGQRYGDHCRVDAYCPDPSSTNLVYLQTRFAERDADERITARAANAKALEFTNLAS